MDWVETASAVTAVLALVVSVVVAVTSRRDARESAAAADRSAVAAEEAAGALRRAAEVAERTAVVPEPAWDLQSPGRYRWRLVNVGTAPAHDVKVRINRGGTEELASAAEVVRPNERLEFHVSPDSELPPPGIEVEYRASREAAEVLVWARRAA